MKSNQEYVEDANQFLHTFLVQRQEQLGHISAEATALVADIVDLSTGGKRLRALLAYLGYRAYGGKNYECIVAAGAALEMFQTAALIHDDIIDKSLTRRGKVTIHQRYALEHGAQKLAGNAEDYGIAAAILAGDMCLSWSEELFTQATNYLDQSNDARHLFDQMRFEVMAGQFMDIHEEVAFEKPHSLNAFERAFLVLTYKAARYSVERPLVIGTALAHAPEQAQKNLSDFGLPLGQAYQLRDDILGIFGDPEITGKPAGDDIREGKRTVLIAHTLEHQNQEAIDFLNAHLGDEKLNTEQLQRILDYIKDSGALARSEELIDELQDKSMVALEKIDVEEDIYQELLAMAQKLTQRQA